ncbi:MAG TPA: hypothetical protein VMU87_05600 [Stellaceae bacterium]|nr:hypothetical protein [Stellaceae bacterium]
MYGFVTADFAAGWRVTVIGWEAGHVVTPARSVLLAAFALIAMAIAVPFILAPGATRGLERAVVRGPARGVQVGLVIAGFAMFLAAVWVLRAFPNSGDEYDYLFGANTILAGRLWNPLLPGQAFFSFFHIFQKAGKWVEQYPPGWPGLLAATRWVGLPFWIASPVLGTLLLVFLARLAGRLGGAMCAVVALLLYLPSAFAVINSGSFFSHVPAALFGLVFTYYGLKFLDAPRWGSALLAGAGLGVLGTIRPFDVPVFAMPFAVEFLWRARSTHYVRVLGIILAGLPFLAILCAYNDAITGHPFLLVTSWGYPLLKIGIPSVSETGLQSSLLDTTMQAGGRIIELAEWTSPILLLAYAPALLWRWHRRELRFHDFVFPMIVAAFLLYPTFGDNRYGPRYYFEAYPLFVMTIATAAVSAWSTLDDARLRGAIVGLVPGHVVTCLISLVLISLSLRQVIDERMDLYDQVAQAGIHDAIVVVGSGTGVLRPMEPRDLLRNGINRTGDVIYALDLPGRLSELRRMFPGRKFYIYDRASNVVRGRLTPLAAP